MPKEYRSGQLGNMAPLHGEFEIKQNSSSLPALTIMGATGGSTSADSILAIQRAGTAEFSSVGTTPVFRVEHDGVWGMRKVVVLSSANAVTMAASQSGAFCVIPDNTAAAAEITLPTAAAGLWYEFYQAGGAAGSGTYVVGAATGLFVVYGDVAADGVNIGGTATATPEGGSLRVICDGTKWYTVMQPAVSSVAMATNSYTLYGIVS